jgi:hypothetical protein
VLQVATAAIACLLLLYTRIGAYALMGVAAVVYGSLTFL